MRTINLIVIHCSATREDKSFTEYDLDICHRSRSFNKESIGICYEGGLDCMGQPKDTRTCWQKHSLRVLILTLLKEYPDCRICGHRDLSPDLNGNGEIEPEEWIKACPCFNAEKDWDKV